MKKSTLLIAIILFLCACSNKAAVELTAVPPTPTVELITEIPSTEIPSTEVISPTPVLVNMHELPAGDYLVISVYENNSYTNSKGHSLYVISDVGEIYGKIAEDRFGVSSRISPSLNNIAFLETVSGGWRGVKIWNLLEEKVIETNFDCIQPEWSPNGDMLAIRCSPDIVVLELTESFEIEKFSILPRYDAPIPYLSDPKWSPDGKWIAYYEEFDHQVYEDRGPFFIDARCLLESSECKTAQNFFWDFLGLLEWSPDSKQVAIAQSKWNNQETYPISIFNVASGKLEKEVGEIPINNGHVYSMSWSPDGEWIAFRTINSNYVQKILVEDGSVQTIIGDRIGFDSIQIIDWVTIP